MDSDNDSANSNDGPIHRRRTQGTRPPPNPMHRMSGSNTNADRTYHPTKEDAPYSDDDELDEDEDEDDDDHQRRHHQQSTYRGRGRPSQQQHLMDSSYDDNEHHDLPRYTGPLREQDRFFTDCKCCKNNEKRCTRKRKNS